MIILAILLLSIVLFWYDIFEEIKNPFTSGKKQRRSNRLNSNPKHVQRY